MADTKSLSFADLATTPTEDLQILKRMIANELARRTKSAQDRAYYQGHQAALAAAARSRQQQDMQKLLEEGDEYEIGARFKAEALKRKELDPQLEASRKAGHDDGFSRGYSTGLGELGAALEDVPFWQEMSRVEREAFMEDTGAPRDFLTRVLAEGISRSTNKELKKLQEKQVREAEIEARAGEPSPTVAVGSPSASFKNTDDVNRAYAEGRLGTENNPHGGEARKRYIEALARFGETP